MPTSLTDPAVKAAFAAAQQSAHPSPADWRDHWIYFLLVDRFDNPNAPPNKLPYDAHCLPYQGGTLQGIRNRLPYLRDLGVGALWLSPILKNPASFTDFYGGYAISDFLNVEPRFCANPAAARANPALADQEFRDLVDAAHAHGLYVILDIVLNHAGDLFTYANTSNNPPWKPNGPEYDIQWRNAAGAPQPAWTDIASIANLPTEAGVWPKELQRNDFFRRRGNEGSDPLRGDFYILRELVTEYLEPATGIFPVRDILIRAYQYLIARFDLDGYRIDTLMYVERDFARIFGNAMREFAQSIGKKNFFTFGEVWKEDDESIINQYHGRNTLTDDNLIVGVDAVLDFPIFKRLRDIAKAQRPPAHLASYYDYRREAQKSVASSHGESGRFFVTFLDNHDLPDRLYFQDPADPTRWDNQFTLALTLLYTLIGVPCLYYGNEQGLKGHSPPGQEAREYAREALWGKPGAFDPNHPFYKIIRSLAQQRRDHPALRYGRQYFRELSGDGNTFGFSPYPGGVAAFSRILNDRELVIAANTSTTDPTSGTPTEDLFITVDRALHAPNTPWTVLFSNQPNPTPPENTSLHNGRTTVKVRLRKMEAQIIGVDGCGGIRG